MSSPLRERDTRGRGGRTHSEGELLYVWVLVSDLPLERSHSSLGENRSRSNLVGDLERSSDILSPDRQIRRGSLVWRRRRKEGRGAEGTMVSEGAKVVATLLQRARDGDRTYRLVDRMEKRPISRKP